ncbi:TPA: hypothetical protein ACXHW4_004202 [Enterobacter hormaechei]
MIAYLEKFLALVERFVVAHELIAANSKREYFAAELVSTEPVKEVPVEGEDIIDTKPTKAKPEPEDDLADDEDPEEKPKRKSRQTKPKEEPKGPDVAKLREEIKTIAKAIAAGDSDECADDFDDLLESFSVRTVTKLKDEDVVAFLEKAKVIMAEALRVELNKIYAHVKAGEHAECLAEFDELLEDYKVRTVTKLADEDVEAFHKDATKLVGKYYEIDED